MQDLAWYRSTYYAANLWLRKVSHIQKLFFNKIQWPWARVYGDTRGPAGFPCKEHFKLGALFCLYLHQRALCLARQVQHHVDWIQRNVFKVGVGRIICKYLIHSRLHGLDFNVAVHVLAFSLIQSYSNSVLLFNYTLGLYYICPSCQDYQICSRDAHQLQSGCAPSCRCWTQPDPLSRGSSQTQQGSYLARGQHSVLGCDGLF